MHQRNPYEPPLASLIAVGTLSGAADTQLHYAGFWRRFLALWVDALTMLPLTGIAFYFGEKTRLFYFYWLVPGLLIGLWFHVYLVKRYGGTPGKLLLKTRIAMVDGSPATSKAAAVRYSVQFFLSALASIALLISCLSMSDEQYFSLGYIARNKNLVELAPSWYFTVIVLMQIWVWGEYLTMFFNKKRRAVQDLMAGTVVVRTAQDS